jgi:hypothetical protein
MIRRLLLVDFENISTFDLSRLEPDVDIVVFVGADQKVPLTLYDAAAALGDRVIWLKMGGTGHNALDFHIACYLGRVLEISKKYACYVLSRDKGFDPLLKYLNGIGLPCTRIENLAPLGIDLSPEDELNYRRAVEALGKIPKKSRPHSRLSLIKLIAATQRPKPNALQINAILARMQRHKLFYLREDDTVSYG